MLRIRLFILVLFSALTLSSQTGKVREISDLIKKEYAFPLNVDSILQPLHDNHLADTTIIRELFSHLDPHSVYLDATRYAEFKFYMSGNFSGIGITFSIVRDTVLVTRVFEGGPASEAGLKPGDRILQINDNDVANKKIVYEDVIAKLRGPSATQVHLTIQRSNGVELIPVSIIRGQIEISSVNAYYMIDATTGYLKFSSFSSSTTEDVHNALASLVDAGMQQLILDLRDNAGGYMKSALKIADEFIPGKKLAVYTIGKGDSRENYYTKKKGLFESGKMIVVVNEATASSAEFLTGALQDNHRAIVIGNRSYGKGLVQRVFTLSDNSTAVILTTSRYYTPSGRCIQRSYEYGVDAYRNEYEAIRKNNGVLPDSLKSRREINWGIIPDQFSPADTLPVNQLFRQLYYSNILSDIAISWFAEHVSELESYSSSADFISRFTVGTDVYASLENLIEERNQSEENEFGKIVFTDALLQSAVPKIEIAIKAYLAQTQWGDNVFYEIFNATDQELLFSLSSFDKL